MLERQEDIYNCPPAKVALDGGFASKENLEAAKKQGVRDVCFSKGRGLVEKDMCRSNYVYKMLKKFRAGIESGISWLKRVLGLDRCLLKGYDSFKSYVWASHSVGQPADTGPQRVGLRASCCADHSVPTGEVCLKQ